MVRNLLAGIPAYLKLKESTQHISIMITDVLSGIANLRFAMQYLLNCIADRWSTFTREVIAGDFQDMTS